MHVSAAEIARFRARQLPADALVAFADHLAVCADCRQRTAALPDEEAVERALDEALGLGDDAHVPELDIHAFVDGTVDEARRNAISAHIALCATCAAEVRDLREYIVLSTHTRQWRPWRYALAAAAAVALIGLAFSLLTRTPEAIQIAALVDVGGELTLDSRGGLHGTGALTRAAAGLQVGPDGDRLRDALANGRIAIPAELRSLSGERGALRGANDVTAFHLLSPVATVVLARQPTLRWTPATGATSYTVTIQNEQSGEVTSSPGSADTTWVPDRPLVEGATYTWQVAATVGSVEQVAPAPPAPPARFRVATSADAERLAILPQSHLVRGVVYASAGLLDDAEREFAMLAAANPDSPLVARLVLQLRTARP